MGQDVSMPVFVSPAALARLVHPDGEKAIARGVQNTGIIQCVRHERSLRIPNNSF